MEPPLNQDKLDIVIPSAKLEADFFREVVERVDAFEKGARDHRSGYEWIALSRSSLGQYDLAMGTMLDCVDHYAPSIDAVVQFLAIQNTHLDARKFYDGSMKLYERMQDHHMDLKDTSLCILEVLVENRMLDQADQLIRSTKDLDLKDLQQLCVARTLYRIGDITNITLYNNRYFLC